MSTTDDSYSICYSLRLLPSYQFHPMDILGLKDVSASITKEEYMVYPCTQLKKMDHIVEKSSEFIFYTFFGKYPEFKPSFLNDTSQLSFSYEGCPILPHDTCGTLWKGGPQQERTIKVFIH